MVEFKILFGENKGRVVSKEEGLFEVEKWADENHYPPHCLSFDSNGDYKDFTTGDLLLQQIKPRKLRDRKIVILKATRDHIDRLQAKLRIKYKNYFVLD